jgi:hypothetical protein
MNKERLIGFVKKFKKTFLAIPILFVLDVFFMNSGLISLLVSAAAVYLGVPRTLWALIRHRREVALERLVRVGLYLIISVAVFGALHLLNLRANRIMKTVIKAVEAYHQQYNEYPQGLEYLVPQFLNEIPAAKPTLMGASFMYFSSPHNCNIRYATMPLKAFEYYNFDRQRWGYYQVDNEPPNRDYEEGITFYGDKSHRNNQEPLK